MVSDSLNSSLEKLRHHSDASLLQALQTNISRTMLIRRMSSSLSTPTTAALPPTNARHSSATTSSNATSATPARVHKVEREGSGLTSATRHFGTRSSTALTSWHLHIIAARARSFCLPHGAAAHPRAEEILVSLDRLRHGLSVLATASYMAVSTVTSALCSKT